MAFRSQIFVLGPLSHLTSKSSPCRFLQLSVTIRTTNTIRYLNQCYIRSICGISNPLHQNINNFLNPINEYSSVISRRCKSTNNEPRDKPNSSLSEVKDSQGQVTIGEKVKQTTKDVYYTGIIVAGIGITGIMCYYIFRELFSSQSPNSVYTRALKLCKENPKIVDILGEPIKGYGELSSRGRRRHVSHMEFLHDEVKHMRMKFYIEGTRKKGTVHLEVKENNEGKYEFRYLFVELNDYPRETIILHDNR